MKELFRSSGPPMPRLALGFVAGALLIQQLTELPGLGLCAALSLACAVSLRWRWLGVAAFGFGLLWATGYAAIRLRDALPTMTERQIAVIEGTVLSIPDAMERGARFDFAIDAVLEPAAAQIPKRVRLNWYDVTAAPKAGERWRLRVSLRRPHGMLNPGGFDYEQWLFAQGIRAVGYVRKSPDNRRLEGGGADVLSRRVWRQAVYDQLSETLAGSPVAGLVKALTMGHEDDITPEQWDVLRKTGTAHLVAVSGSHIGLIAGFVFFLTRRAVAWLGVLRWSPPLIAALAGLAAAWLYSALADFTIPTQRAMLMVGVAMGAVILQRNLNPPHILATALLAVTLYDPLAVLSPGFWLSFGAVALMAFVLSGRTGRTGAGWSLVRINWATALGLAPVLLLFFRQVSLVSPLANLLAVPVLGTLLIPVCLVGALLLPVIQFLGAGLLHLAEIVLVQIWPALEWLAALPLAQWTHAEPPFWTIPLAMAGTLLLLAPRGIPARWLGLVLLVPAATVEPEPLSLGVFRLTLLDVGQGLASVVETRSRTLVFDTGAQFSPRFDMGGAVIEPFLRQRGLGRIDALVVSHGDNDHSGGANTLLRRFPVEMLYTSVPTRLAEFPAVLCGIGQRWTWDGVDFEMLGPIQASEKDNDNSCVLRVGGGEHTALLTGDIERMAENLLVEKYGEALRSEVLVVPHHGSKTSSTREFLAAVNPRLALMPAGYLNRFGFPHREVLDRYAAIGAKVLNTASAGAIAVVMGRAGGLRAGEYRREQRRYWHER
ncbi:DNA internalization-related competence protein ComEC/Rec2 [Methylomagnum sp.]